MSQVELPLPVQQRLFDVFLDDISFKSAIVMFFLFFEDSFDLVEVETDDDSVAPIGVFSRFDDPGVEFVDAVGIVPGCLAEDVIILEKLEVLVIFESVFDVKGEGKMVEDVETQLGVILVHGLEEGLLVADDEVVEEVVVDSHLLLHLPQRSLTHLEQIRPVPQVLLSFTLLLHVVSPVVLPFSKLQRVQHCRPST